MKPVDMVRHAVESTEGDCLQASIASILELDVAALPYVAHFQRDQWFGIVSDHVRALGYRLVEFGNDPAVSPPGYAIAIGPSPRTDGVLHACVAENGDVIHDPHPSRDGLERITYWLLLVPFARHIQRTSPVMAELQSVL
jgi:hypothetical protein